MKIEMVCNEVSKKWFSNNGESQNQANDLI